MGRSEPAPRDGRQPNSVLSVFEFEGYRRIGIRAEACTCALLRAVSRRRCVPVRYAQTVPSALEGIRRQLCPRCRQGRIFRAPLWRGFLAMHERCPVCGLKFEREPGYFLGALYFSYAFSIPPGLLLVLLLWRITGWSFNAVMFAAFVAYLPF